MDALRADKLRAFSPGARAETPATDELAKSGVVFRQFYVQGNESQTSHASIWTATFPAVHGVRMAGPTQRGSIKRTLDHLGEQMKARGFATAAVTGNGFVNADNGYARGFDEFRNMMREKNTLNGYIPGAKIVDAALAQLDARKDGPTFLFIGTIDTHNPPVAQRPWIDQYYPQRWNEVLDLGFIPGRMGCHIIPPPHHIERLRAIYDSEVSYQDSQLGRFVEELKHRGIYDQTMILITADHGEELFEETRCGHGASLRESLVRVPLLVYYPARFPAGTIVE
jgi:arylsulfatase A-like enzyme